MPQLAPVLSVRPVVSLPSPGAAMGTKFIFRQQLLLSSVYGGGRGAAVSGAQLHREGNVDYDNGTRGAKWTCAWYVGARAMLLCGMDMPRGARSR